MKKKYFLHEVAVHFDNVIYAINEEMSDIDLMIKAAVHIDRDCDRTQSPHYWITHIDSVDDKPVSKELRNVALKKCYQLYPTAEAARNQS